MITAPLSSRLLLASLLVLAPICSLTLACGDDDDQNGETLEESDETEQQERRPPELATELVWFSMELEGAAYEPNHPQPDRGRTVHLALGAHRDRTTGAYDYAHLFTTDRELWQGTMAVLAPPQLTIDDQGITGTLTLWYDDRALPIDLDVQRAGDELMGTYTSRPSDGFPVRPDRDATTVEDITASVQGVVITEEDARANNDFDSPLSWPTFLGREQALFSGGGFSLINDPEDLRIHWRSETIWGPRFRYCRNGWAWLNNTPSGGAASVVGHDGILYVAHRRPRATELGGAGETIPCFFTSMDADERQLMEARFVGDLGFAEDKVASVIGVRADEVLTAIDAVTGQTLWETTFEAAGINFFEPRESPTNMTGAVDDERVYTRDTLGVLRAFDRWNGDLLWERQIPYRYLPQYGPVTRPFSLDEFYQQVLAGGGFGFDEGRMGHGLATAEFYVIAPLHDGNTGLVAYEGTYGLTLWKIHEEILNRRMTPITWHHEDENPLDSQDYLLTIDSDGFLHLIDAQIGRVVWRLDTEWSDHGQPVLVDDLLITHAGAYEISREGAEFKWDARGCVGPDRIAATVVGDRAFLRCNLVEDNGSWDSITCRNDDCHLQVRDLETGQITDELLDNARSQWAHSFGLGDYLVLEERSDSQELLWAIHDIDELREEPTLTVSMPFAFEASSRAHLVHPTHQGRVFVRGSDGLYALDLRRQ